MGTVGSDLLLCGAISSVNGANGTFTHTAYQLLGIMLGDLYMETHLDLQREQARVAQRV